MPLTTLFLDLNAYFASVEQQVNPALRGKPVGVAPITGDSGCCIAVSYEAKAFGVKTGTRVGDARALCPGIRIVDARPRLYVLMHHRVLKAIDRHIPIDKVHSIDEVSCLLDRTQCTVEACRRLAQRIKASIRATCGECMRCSIGIAPNRTLAKLGTDLQKPDGLVIFRDEDLPGAIAHLAPEALSGIGPAMSRRLRDAGITTIAELLARSEPQMRALWGGLVGERWYHILRGCRVHEPTTHKSSIGHQHVLAPHLRTPEAARTVAVRLLLKAGARMRHGGYAARKLSLSIHFADDPQRTGAWGRTSWHRWAAMGDGCADSATMLDALDPLWAGVPRRPVLQVGVTLYDLVPPASLTLPLFNDQRKRESVSRAMDTVNARFGPNVLYTATMQRVRVHGTGGIAYGTIPDLSVPDSVQSRQRPDSSPSPLLTDAEMKHMIEASLRPQEADLHPRPRNSH